MRKKEPNLSIGIKLTYRDIRTGEGCIRCMTTGAAKCVFFLCVWLCKVCISDRRAKICGHVCKVCKFLDLLDELQTVAMEKLKKLEKLPLTKSLLSQGFTTSKNVKLDFITDKTNCFCKRCYPTKAFQISPNLIFMQ